MPFVQRHSLKQPTGPAWAGLCFGFPPALLPLLPCQPCNRLLRPAAAAPVGAHHDLPAHGLNLMNTALQVRTTG